MLIVHLLSIIVRWHNGWHWIVHHADSLFDNGCRSKQIQDVLWNTPGYQSSDAKWYKVPSVMQLKLECGACCCITGTILAIMTKRPQHALLSLTKISNLPARACSAVAWTYELKQWEPPAWLHALTGWRAMDNQVGMNSRVCKGDNGEKRGAKQI